MLTISFVGVGSRKVNFEIKLNQLNSDVLIRAIKHKGHVSSNAIKCVYDEVNKTGSIIDELSNCSIGSFNVVV